MACPQAKLDNPRQSGCLARLWSTEFSSLGTQETCALQQWRKENYTSSIRPLDKFFSYNYKDMIVFKAAHISSIMERLLLYMWVQWT